MSTRRLAAAAAVVAGCAVAVVAVLGTPAERVVARQDIRSAGGGTTSARDVTARCGLVGGTADSDWGRAGDALCARPTASRLRLAGGLGTVGGGIGLWLARRRRSGRQPRTQPARFLTLAPRAGGSALVVVGLPIAAMGVLLPMIEDEVRPLAADERAILDALPDGEVVTAFEVADEQVTSFGSTIGEQLWVVLATVGNGGVDVDAVRGGLEQLGWEAGEVATQFSDGWVRLRGAVGADVLEVGLVADALADTADLPRNGRRLLDETVPDGSNLVVVHLRPSRFGDPGAE
ncbi:MAG: hypothetical protein ACRD0G_13120 [Acidimicrobiales bacterium]